MKYNEELPYFPVTEWQLKLPPEDNLLILRIGYSTSSHGKNASTFDSPCFSLSPEKAKSLLHDLHHHLARCQLKMEEHDD